MLRSSSSWRAGGPFQRSRVAHPAAHFFFCFFPHHTSLPLIARDPLSSLSLVCVLHGHCSPNRTGAESNLSIRQPSLTPSTLYKIPTSVSSDFHQNLRLPCPRTRRWIFPEFLCPKLLPPPISSPPRVFGTSLPICCVCLDLLSLPHLLFYAGKH